MTFVYSRCNIKLITDRKTRKKKGLLNGSGEEKAATGFSALLGFRDVAGAPPTGGFAIPRVWLLPFYKTVFGYKEKK